MYSSWRALRGLYFVHVGLESTLSSRRGGVSSKGGVARVHSAQDATHGISCAARAGRSWHGARLPSAACGLLACVFFKERARAFLEGRAAHLVGRLWALGIFEEPTRWAFGIQDVTQTA